MENWDDLRIFLSVMRAGATLGAARDLGIAQTTVARRIDALEHALGLTLFTRDTRGFHPTKAADALLTSAQAAEKASAAFFEQAARLGDDRDRNIRITTSSSDYELVMSTLIAEFSAVHPGVRFHPDISDRTLNLAEGEADVAVRFGPKSDGDDVLCRRLGGHSWSVYCSAGYAEAHGAPDRPAALKQHCVISFDEDGPAERVRSWWADHVLQDNVLSRCPTVKAILVAVQSGIGVGALPDILTLTVDPPLVRCMNMPSHTDAEIWLMVSPMAKSRQVVRRFADFIADNYIRVMREAIPKARDGR